MPTHAVEIRNVPQETDFFRRRGTNPGFAATSTFSVNVHSACADEGSVKVGSHCNYVWALRSEANG